MIAPNLTLRPDDKLDGYDLEDVVATSGMATAFRARDLKCGLQATIKVPHPEVESGPTMFDRFRREEEMGGKSYAAPRAGDGIDFGHIDLCVARLFPQYTKVHTKVL